MTAITVRPGEVASLAVNIKGATKDVPITFEIKAGSESLTTLTGVLQDGTATADWKVDVGARALPLDVTFTATSGGKAVSSGTMQVVAPAPVVGPLGVAGTATLAAGTFMTANGVLLLDVGVKLPMTTTALVFQPGEIEVFIDDVPADASQPGAALGPAIHRQALTASQLTTVSFEWQTAPVGKALVRVRADVKQAGKVVEQRRSGLIVLLDWVDVTLKDPASIATRSLGAEGRERHVFLSGDPMPEVPEPAPAPAPPPVTAHRQAAWAADALVVEIDGKVPPQGAVRPDEAGVARVRFAHGLAGAIAIRAEQTAFRAAWRDADAASLGEASHRVVQPRSAVTVPLTARRRLSLWLSPGDLFGWPMQVHLPWPFTKHVAEVRDHVDDVVLLNLFTPVPAAKIADTSIRYVGIHRGNAEAKLADLRRVIAGCRAAQTQVLLGHGGIIASVDDSPWLGYLRKTADLSDDLIAAQAKKVVELVLDRDKLDVDGLDFDLEHLTTESVWPMELRRRVRVWFRALAVELAARGKLLGIASASFISHAMVADHTPATGSGSGQTFTLAVECPNILLRPMCYDNGFLDAALLDFQRRVVKFALADAPAGAGVHPAQFQIGVKTFQGTNNSTLPTKPPVAGETADERKAREAINAHRLKGWYRDMPKDLLTICRDTLAPTRVGVICFGPPFQHLADIDAALNPLPGDKKQFATDGTPLQGPVVPIAPT